MRFVLLWLTTCAAVSAASAEERVDELVVLDSKTVFALAESLSRVTREPELVPVGLAEACVMPTEEDHSRAESTYGPHTLVPMHFYASAQALPLIARPMRMFPVGTVLLKEKLRDWNNVTAVGGMRKRERGYDVQHGDWEYFYAEKGGEPAVGRLPSCIACHAAAASTDYVYRVEALD